MMNLGKKAFGGKSPAADVETLCDLLLQIGGRDTNRLPSVRRHVAVLDAAIPHMTKAQAQVARERIRRFETKWGPMLAGSEKETGNDGIPPEMRVAAWLSVRRVPERYLLVLYRAANCVWDGETALSRIMDYAFAYETDRVLHPVGYDSFSEWMFQLRIAIRTGKAVYRPGELCRWWVEEMKPTSRKDTSYAACLQQVLSLKSKRA